MNRISPTFNKYRELIRICPDEPIELYWIDPNILDDFVYFYGSVLVGSKFVEKALKKHSINHLDERAAVAGRLDP